MREGKKMENEIKAPKDGMVSKINVSEGDVLEENTSLMEIKGSKNE